MDELILEKQWDKTFPQSNKVNYRKVTFLNRYGITLATNLYNNKEIVLEFFFNGYLYEKNRK